MKVQHVPVGMLHVACSCKFRENWIIANPKNTFAELGKMPGQSDSKSTGSSLLVLSVI